MLRHPLHVLWSRAGSSPAAVLVLHVALSQYSLFALLRPLSLPGLPGGFQMAANGYEKVSTCEVHPILMAVRKLIGNIHVVALWRPWFFLRDEAEKSATHDGSAYGLVSGFAVPFGFALRPSFGLLPLFLAAVGCLCSWCSLRPSVSCALGLSFRWYSSLVRW